MTSKEKVNILLVDDKPQRLVSYEAILSDLGENLVRATSGAEALSLLMKQTFAVILLDVNMPGMDGFETADLIHRHPRYEKTPIIFVTAVHVTDLDRLKGYNLGAVDYVYIPVVPEILRSKVQVLVELFRRRRQLEELNASLTSANDELARANALLKDEKTRELKKLNETLERANAELERANLSLSEEARRKDEFLALLAHELRNPLNPIRNAVEIMRSDDSPRERLEWAWKLIDRQVNHLTRLIDDLLDVSRITRSRLELKRQRIDLLDVVRAAVDASRAGCDQLEHELSITLPEQPQPVEADIVRLTQVFSNLLSNAMKFTPTGRPIRVILEAGPNTAQVTVKDSGIGIDAEHLPHVFDMFYQVDSSIGRSHGGLGIGLMLVKKLVELHGGSVEARSAGRDHGSEFIVSLPLASPLEASSRSRDAIDRAGMTGRRVVVADDNADSAESLSMLLSLYGNEVSTAYNGRDAVSLAEQIRPEIMLLDIGMPEMNGYEVAKEIRREPWGADVVLIALTGWGKEEDRRLSREAGFNHHFVKPLSVEDLGKVLASIDVAAKSPMGSRRSDPFGAQEAMPR
jgi:signal transduction histidine kinase